MNHDTLPCGDTQEEFSASYEAGGFYRPNAGLMEIPRKDGWGYGPRLVRFSDAADYADLMKYANYSTLNGKFVQGIPSVTSGPSFYDFAIRNEPVSPLVKKCLFDYYWLGLNEKRDLYREKGQGIIQRLERRERSRLTIALRRPDHG